MTHHQQGGPLGPYAISVIRTVVPLAWGYIVTWLIHLGLPADLLSNPAIVTGLGALVTAGWYAAWRWGETRIPSLDSWAAKLVVIIALGHPATPSYGTAPTVPMDPTPPTPVRSSVADTVVTDPVAPPNRG